MATIHHLNYATGSDANNGTTWALAWRTLTEGATAARIAPGDVIRIAKSPDPTSLGINATWTNLSRAVTLASALTANVEMCDTTWTGVAANVTQAVTATRKEGANAIQFTIAAAFTTGRVAWRTIPQTDFSAFQQLSFWFRTSVAVWANTLRIDLCSDDLGQTPVDSFIIPAMPGTGRFAPFTINKGSALGSAIRSVALFAIVDPGTSVVILDNIIAVRPIGSPDSLSLTSLISKNSLAQGGTEGWFGIKSINGTAIELDMDTNSLAGSGRGYLGITETVLTFKRETIKTDMVANSWDNVQEIMDSGTLGNNIQFQGGWDTATNTQNGETFFDGQNGNGRGILISSKSFTTLNLISVCRYDDGIRYESSNNNTITTLTNVNNNNNDGVFYSSSHNNIITTLTNVNNNNSDGITYSSSNNNIITTLTNVNSNTNGINYFFSDNNTINALTNANNNGNNGVTYISSSNNTINALTNVNNNGNNGIAYSSSNNNTIRSLSTLGNSSRGMFNDTGTNFISNALIAEATEVGLMTAFANSRLFSHNHDRITDNHWIFTDGGTINAQTAVRHSPTGIAWRLSPTHANRSASYPLNLSIARIAVAANALVTVRGWFRRNNTGITGRLVCRGRQIAGVDSDVVATMDAPIDTWQQLTITFTPTENGVVEIEGQAFGGTSWHIFIDDMTITQA